MGGLVEGCKGRGGGSGAGTGGQMGMQVGRRGGSGRRAGEQIRRLEKAWHVGGERIYRDCGDEGGGRARQPRRRRAEKVESLLMIAMA